MRGTNLLPIFDNGQDARKLGARSFAALSLQGFAADVLGVRSKALCWGHDPIEVRRKAFRTWGTGVTPRQRFSRGDFGRPVLITVGVGGHFR